MNLCRLAILLSLLYSCSSSQSQESVVATKEAPKQISIEPARYKATVNLEHVPDSMRGYSMASDVYFGLEENNRFVYEVNAMGRPINDVGEWAINEDTLYIFNLEKGPNTKFKIEENENGTFNIYGPNNFILAKDEKYQPTKN